MPDMISGFSDVPVGKLGDQFGSLKYKELHVNSVHNWQKVFSTSFRKRYLKNYIRKIGKSPVEAMGYDFDDLINQIEAHKVKFSPGLVDRLDLIGSEIISRFELMLFTEKYLNRNIVRNRKFLMH
jgi:hypothetical protein